jgi:hypothetical protein
MSGSIKKKSQVQLVYKKPLKIHIVALGIVTKPQSRTGQRFGYSIFITFWAQITKPLQNHNCAD